MKKIGYAIVFVFFAFIATSLLSILVINSYHKVKSPETEAVEEVKHAGMRFSEEPKKEALGALQILGDQRAYPEKFIPEDGYYRAHEYAQNRMKRVRSLDNWVSIGPANQGGRTIGLCVDPKNPNTIYAGSASGGLWRLTISTSSSYTWEYVETGYPVLGVNAIVVDHTNSDIIYIGTGEMYSYEGSFGGFYVRSTRGSVGIGLLKSTDRGKTWKKSIDWSYNQRRGVLSMKMHPTDPGILFAGTSEGVYRTKNGGETWELVHTTLMAVDLAINPNNPEIIYASCGNLSSPGSGIYRSKSGGDSGSWTKLGGGLPSSWGGKALLSIYKASPNIIFASIGEAGSSKGLYSSTDNGDTWTLLTSEDVASYQGWFAHYVRVHPADKNKVMCAGVNFYFSTDGGKTLSSKSGMHVDHHCYADHPADPNIVYFGNDGGVYRTTDGGSSFQSLNKGYVTSQFYNGFSCSAKDPNCAIGGLQDNSTVLYQGTTTWKTGIIGGDGAFTAINTQDDKIMFGSSQNLSVSRSADRGQSWSNISSQLSGGSVCFVAPFVLAPSKPAVLYAGTSYIFRTDNSGSDWVKMNGSAALNGNAILSIGVSPNNPDVVYAATVPTSSRRSEVFTSTDGGTTFKKVTGALPDRYYLDIQISPHDDKVAYVSLLGFGTSHLYRTEDGGVTWHDAGQGLPDAPASAVIIDPFDYKHIYVGSDLGVFVSTDYAKTWNSFKDGMPTAALVMDLTVSPSNKKIRAATHGNGVYERLLLSATNPIVDGAKGPFYSNQISLKRSYPNPFRVRTNIEFTVPNSSLVTMQICNLKGQQVRTLISKIHPAGQFSVVWDGRDDFSREVPTGSYICRLTSGDCTTTITMNLIR